MKIAIGADQNGFTLKEIIKAHLIEHGHEVTDYGNDGAEPVDYPDVAEAVAEAVADGRHDRAVLVCGTGLGMAIAANKVPGIRAAAVQDPYSAERASKSNNAQVLCLGGQVVGQEVARILVDRWLNSEFAGGGSAPKVAKIDALDDKYRVSRREDSDLTSRQ